MLPDKALAILAREYSSAGFRCRDGTVAIWTSSCVSAPTYRPIIDDRTQLTNHLYTSIANYCVDATAAGQRRKDMVLSAAADYGVSLRTVETAISATLSSST